MVAITTRLFPEFGHVGFINLGMKIDLTFFQVKLIGFIFIVRIFQIERLTTT